MKKVIGIISTAFGCFFLLFAIGMGVVFGLVGHGISGMKDDTDYSSNEYTSCIGTIVATESGDDKNTTISYEVNGTLYEKSYNIYSSAYPVGHSVAVFYKVGDPAEGNVPELVNDTVGGIGTIFSGMGVGIAILFGIIGITFLITGIVLIKIANKEMKNSNTYE